MKTRFSCLFPFLVFGLLLQVSPEVRPGGQKTPAVLPAAPSLSAAAKPQNHQVRAQLDFGRMPLYFIANQGRMDERVAFYAQGADKVIYFTAEGLTVALSGTEKRAADEKFSKGSRVGRGESPARPTGRAFTETPGEGGPASEVPSERWVVKLDFVGARSGVVPAGREKSEAVISYFTGKPEDWRTGLPTYSQVVYSNLWPGIDLIYSGTLNRLKYEFIVHPGADPSRIRLRYRGVTGLSVGDDGRLAVETPAGGLSDDRPVAYQEIGGTQVSVPVAYELEGKGCAGAPGPENGLLGGEDCGSGSYGFEIGEYDSGRPLVIDPAVFVYCGFIGGSGSDIGNCIAVDGSGNAYIAGATGSSQNTFPVTVGPDLTLDGTSDAFVAKVNASGAALSYCGYIGGSGNESAYGIAVDSSGNAYISGETNSSQATFPVLVGPGLTYKGNYDAFVAKVNASGTALSYCGYIGGSQDDYGYAIAVDGSGNACLAGETFSTEGSFPVVAGPDLTFNGSRDAFAAKVNASGASLVYCGFIGGTGTDRAFGVAVDGSGNACVVGDTNSSESSFPVLTGPDLTQNGDDDAFVAKVSASGAFVYCGYIGGSGSDDAWGIAADAQGNAYVTGLAASDQSTFPVKVGPDLTHNGNWDAYVAKVNPSGTGLVYCGYIGGSQSEQGLGIAVDTRCNAYIMGWVQSNETSFPVTRGPDPTYNGGLEDAFVAKVNSSGEALVYCGYIGGSGRDRGVGIAVDKLENAYATGLTSSTQPGFPILVGPDLTYNGGSYDAFVAKIASWDEWALKNAVGDFDGDGADEAAVDFGTSGLWQWDNGAWSQLTTINPEALAAADLDGDHAEELLADLGTLGLWVWNGGASSQLSAADVASLALGDVDADGSAEVVADFGGLGLWVWNSGAWGQISGVNADCVATANLDGAGGDEIIGDFGPVGLWVCTAGVWTQLSGMNADHVGFGNLDGLPGRELIGGFGKAGLWRWSAGGWTQLSGMNAECVIAGDMDADGSDELVGDFGAVGAWLWNDGAWTILSSGDTVSMTAADVDGDGVAELAAGFGPRGLWLRDGGSWVQLSGVGAEQIIAGDVDGDLREELFIDFGPLGLWLWTAGSWSQLSALNPE